MLICIELNLFFSIKGFGVPWDIFVMAESEMQQGQEVVEARQRAHALVARNPQETVRALFESLPDLPATQRLRPADKEQAASGKADRGSAQVEREVI